jgi:hypothetical protein
VVQSGGVNGGELNSAQNAINLSEFILPLTVSFSKMLFSVAVADASNNSDIGIVDASGSLKCDVGAQTFATTGTKDLSCTQGSVTLQPGRYYFAFTTAAATPTLKIRFSTLASGFFWIGHSNVSSTTSSGGALPPTVAINNGGAILNASAYGYPAFALH